MLERAVALGIVVALLLAVGAALKPGPAPLADDACPAPAGCAPHGPDPAPPDAAPQPPRPERDPPPRGLLGTLLGADRDEDDDRDDEEEQGDREKDEKRGKKGKGRERGDD